MSDELKIKLSVDGFTQAMSQFDALRKTITGFGAALPGALSVAAFTDFMKETVNLADQLGKMSQKTGIATETLSELSWAAKLADVDSGQLSFALKELSKELVKSGQGGAQFDQILFSLADEFAAMKDGPEKAARALDLFGRSGLDMIPFLNQGSDAIREQMKEAQRFGLVLSKDITDAADRFNDNIDKCKAVVRGFGNALISDLLPPLNKVASLMGGEFTSVARGYSALKEKAGVTALRMMPGGGAFADAWEYNKFLQDQGKKASVALGYAQPRSAEWVGPMPKSDFDWGGIQGQKDLAQEWKDRQDHFQKVTKLDADMAENFHQSLAEIESEMQADLAQEWKDRQAQWDTALQIEQNAQNQRAQMERETSELIVRIREQEDAKKAQLQARALDATQQAFSDAAMAAKVFGKKAFGIYKAFAISETIISTYRSAQQAFDALSWIKPVGPVLGAAAAAAAVAAGMARVAMIAAEQPGGYAEGGYTGDGSAGQVAGNVHRKEYVLNAATTERIGVPTLDAMQYGGGAGTGKQVSVAFYDDRRKLLNELNTIAGERIIVELMRKNRCVLKV